MLGCGGTDGYTGAKERLFSMASSGAGFDTAPLVRWREESRRLILPRRGADVPALSLPDRRELHERIVEMMRRHEKELRSGLNRAGDRCADLSKGALDVFLSRRKRGLMVEEAAALQVLLSYFSPAAYRLMAQLLLVDRGAVFALESLCGSFQFGHYGSLADGGYVYLFNAHAVSRHLRAWEVNTLSPEAVMSSRGAWHWLRWALAVADDETYSEAKIVGRRFRLTAQLPLRCALTFAFPTEAEWSTACAEECLARGEPRDERHSWHINALITGVMDADLCTRLATRVHEELGLEYALTVIEHLGPSAVGVFEVLLSRGHAEVLPAVLHIESAEAVDALLHVLGNKQLRPRVVEHLCTIPELALLSLAPRAASVTAERSATARLGAAAIVEFRPEAVEAIVDLVDGEERAFLEALAPPLPRSLASIEELPQVMTSPPWLERRHATEPKLIVVRRMLDHPEELVWAEGEREALLVEHARRHDRGPKPSVAFDEELVGRVQREAKKGRRSSTMSLLLLESFSDPEKAMTTWLSRPAEFWDIPRYAKGHYGHVLWALFGPRCVDGFLSMLKKYPTFALEKLSRINSARVAPAMAEGFVRLKKSRPVAEAWLRRFPRAAAVGLIPDAVGAAKSKRTAAVAALSFLLDDGVGGAVRAVGRAYGKRVKRALDSNLITDPLLALPESIPRLPDFWVPRAIPRPHVIGSGKMLSDEAMNHVATMLAFSTLDRPYVGISQIREACEAGSLETFVWVLFSLWNAVGAPPGSAWAMHALGHLGGDEAASRLTSLIHDWPGQSAHARAVQGLRVLKALGTDVALQCLHDVAERSKYRALKAEAEAMVAAVATERGVSVDELVSSF